MVRRYSDFMALFEVLSCRFPNRIVPPLPPQKFTALVRGVDSEFAEERRKGLLRWLRFLSAHPVISKAVSLQVIGKNIFLFVMGLII